MRKKIGVLGLGSIGKRHFLNFLELGCDVRWYDPGPIAPTIPYTRSTKRGLLEWADAIVIASPTANHWDDIRDCHGANKFAFVEKPIVSTSLQWATVPTSLIKMVGYNLRFHSCVIKAKAWMGAGAIGKPLWARFTCAQYNDKPAYLRDGVILNWSHEIDLALYLLGPATFKAACGQYPLPDMGEETADIIIRHMTCQSVIHLDYLTKPERRGFIIVGEDGAIEVDLVSRAAFRRGKEGKVEEIHNGRDTFDGNYLTEAKAFLNRLDGQETTGCTADEAMHVANICLQAKDEMYV